MTDKILLVDDSITIQKVAELILSAEGFDIKMANNGDEALSVIQAFMPDIVLADIEMPGMNGYRLCELIKTSPDTRHIPVILLAGAFESMDANIAGSAGADDFIVKPFEAQELTSKVSAVLAAKKLQKEHYDAEEATPAEALGISSGERPWEAAAAIFDKENITQREALAEGLPPEPKIISSAMQLDLPSKSEITDLIRDALNEKIAAVLSSADLPDIAGSINRRLSEILPGRDETNKTIETIITDKMSSFLSTVDISSSIERILAELVPQLLERLLKELLQDTLASVLKEAEKVIWETVPSVAEAIISAEIKKIRAEM